jgi:hypothetical protein
MPNARVCAYKSTGRRRRVKPFDTPRYDGRARRDAEQVVNRTGSTDIEVLSCADATASTSRAPELTVARHRDHVAGTWRPPGIKKA